ncbi:NACHT domain-containing NTPase [Actinoplanes sp. TFC3]|uniref:NACHT domain-containing protein n=1 Tax=Actinoplanes sp. TFC3 TaxID=1710355 RepID=UPI0008361879|nr:NACHT domain-containing protein [Actinoplanes sp. TFC3]
MDTIRTISTTVAITLGAVGILAYLRRRVRAVTGEVVRRIVEPIIWLFLRFFRHSMADLTSLRSYCRVQIKNPETRVLHVPGRWGTNLTIKTVYVPLTLESSTTKAAHHPDDIWRDDVSRVRIVGEPGSGKSTFVKHLFLHACEESFRTKSGRLPIILELRQLKPPRRMSSPDKLTDWLMTELRTKVESVHGYEMHELFEAASRGSGLLVLLDGLDEVPSERYPAISLAIAGLSRRLMNDSVKSRLLLTMRSQFHDQVRADFDAHFESTYRVKRFSSADVYTFLTKWPFTHDPLASANRIYGDLTDRPTLREMCSNPLILAMYVANDQGSGSGAPDTRTAFYNHVVEELLVARRSRQLGIAAKSALQAQREQVLGPLAYENLTDPNQPSNSIPWSRAIELATEVHGCSTAEAAEQMLLELCKETGIIAVEKPGESLRFIHLTFCEFLAARECIRIRADGWQKLMELHASFAGQPTTSTRLVEVIPFALGLLAPVQQLQAMDDVWASKNRVLAGYCFLETRRYDHSAWDEYADNEAEGLLSVESSDWDEAFLRRLHLFNIILADENEWRKMYGQPCRLPLEEVFRRLVGRDRSRLTAIFGSYAAFDAPAAFRLARTCSVDLLIEHPGLLIENAALPPFLAMLIEQMHAEPARAEKWAAVLCEAALRQPAVATLLVDMDADALGLDHRVDQINKRRRWFFPWSQGLGVFTTLYRDLRPSALTYATTVATAAPRASGEAETYPHVAALRQVRPTRARLLPATPVQAVIISSVPLILGYCAGTYLLTRLFLEAGPPSLATMMRGILLVVVGLGASIALRQHYNNVITALARTLNCSSLADAKPSVWIRFSGLDLLIFNRDLIAYRQQVLDLLVHQELSAIGQESPGEP